MKDESINKFFKEHKQTIENDGFEARLFETLKYLPKPNKRAFFSRQNLIVPIFSLFGVLLFVLLGGSSTLISSLEQIFYTIANLGQITPESIVAAFLVLVMFAGIGKIVVEEF